MKQNEINCVEITIPPKDYHCNCEYCKNYFKGELIKSDGTYYSGRKRTGYSLKEKETKHLCPGHWQGYKFIIENFSNAGDIVFDPCSGTGTALIEAAKLERKGLGIELKFFDILKENCSLYDNLEIFEGDAREVINSINTKVDLIVTGPPYNNNSDSPERKNLKGKNTTFNYVDSKNIAFLNDETYFKEMIELYRKCCLLLKDGGYFVTIIKDPIRNKKPYLLHKEITDRLKSELELKVVGVYVHRHYPSTLFMNTYNKRFPNVKVPKYQTIVVMQK